MRIAFALLFAFAAESQTNVLTYHNDNAHTGAYLNETLLTPSNVNAAQFGWRTELSLDGPVYAQPLYLSRVNIPGKGLHDVLFVATVNDSVYAIDADDVEADPLWMVNFLDPAKGITVATKEDVGCPVLPELGIIGTPVIDPAAGTIYLIAETKELGNNFVFRLHALDVTTGAERSGSPVEIAPAGFVPLAQKQRASLMLLNGVIYSPWSGHCDNGSFHGLVMAHDAKTLQPLGVFNTTQYGSGASLWSGGAGPVADAEGSVYVVSANGNINGVITPDSYDEAVLKLAAPPQMSVLDNFVPFNRATLNEYDVDLGSSGALLLPDETGSPAHPHLLFTSGKEGRMYLLDRDALGGAQNGSDSAALASLPYFSSHATFGSAAYFNGSIYVAPEHSPMFRFGVGNATLVSSPSAQTPDVLASLGATPSISANANTNGIVWITTFNQGGELFAYDAAGLKKLFDSNAQPGAPPYTFTEFTTPTIAAGKVYVPTFFGVAVYGELPPATAPLIGGVADAASFSPDALAPGCLISIFGSNLSPTTASATAVPLPLSINDVSVTINGIPAPLLYVSARQINAQIPYEVPAGPVSVMVRAQGAKSAPLGITLKTTAPALFTSPEGFVAAVATDGATPGSYVSLFFTGQGPVISAIADGDAPATGHTIWAASPVTATIGGVSAQVQFAGLAPNFPGVAQINLKIPELASGTYPVVINVGGVLSNALPITVTAP